MTDLAEPSRRGHGGASPLASIAVVGGSGFYEFLEDAEEVKIDTPFGAPSDPITVGEVAGPRGAVPPRAGPHPRVPAAQDSLPGQHVGAALDRRPADTSPPRGWLADRFLRPRPAGFPRPASGSPATPGADVLRPGRLPPA